MPKGGARTRSGPPADPNALRRARKDDAGWTTLPAEGRTDPTPDWPLTNLTGREAEVWEQFWRKPQALIWERDDQIEYVALFVRQFIEAEDAKASAENRKTVRMMFADLYLTSDAMARARIRIAGDELAEKRDDRPTVKQSSARDRMKVVDGGGA